LDSELSVLAKLDKVLDFFRSLGWNPNKFLQHFFASKSQDTLCSHHHGIIIEKFFSSSAEFGYPNAHKCTVLLTVPGGADEAVV
jgi:hypothetical protein